MTCAELLLLAALGAAQAQEEFTFNPPGELVGESGDGRDDDTVYIDGMRFPLESAPAYLNSQVYGNGGLFGPSGRECDEENYRYPWTDNFCESRGYSMPLCPSGSGHQGQDIRPASCDKDQHWAVATVDGQIAHIGSYTVSLISEDGTQHRYMHLEPTSLLVKVGSRVQRGERIGRVSNHFVGGDGQTVPTTIHLHYDVQMNLDGENVYVPPYMSLVQAYESLLQSPPDPMRHDSCGGSHDRRRRRLRGTHRSGQVLAEDLGGGGPGRQPALDECSLGRVCEQRGPVRSTVRRGRDLSRRNGDRRTTQPVHQRALTSFTTKGSTKRSPSTRRRRRGGPTWAHSRLPRALGSGSRCPTTPARRKGI